MEFKDMLRYLRKRDGLSQKELAEKLGIAPSTVGNYEQGLRKPKYTTEEAFADFFNVSLDVLRGKSGEGESRIPVFSYSEDAGCDTISDYLGLETEFDVASLFALEIDDDSMSPRIRKSDIVIFLKHDNIASDDIAAISVNNRMLCKRVIQYANGITLLRSDNPAYTDIDVTESADFTVLGRACRLIGRL